MNAPNVKAFFDEPTHTVSYVVSDPQSQHCVIIDSVLNYDASSGHISTTSADALITYISQQGLRCDWILETHVHADHMSAAPYLRSNLGGKIAIGNQITDIQRVFGPIFNAGPDFTPNGAQFDHLFQDGERFQIGDITASVISTPGHTCACVSYLIGDAIFVGDTLFMPDYGSARCDFPGGNAAQLYRSIKTIFDLPNTTRMFLCHDYKGKDRDHYAWETTIGEQKSSNIHIHEGVSEADFVAMRTARDKTLNMPKLILPSIQVNMRAGELPKAEDDGQRYLKIPINRV